MEVSTDLENSLKDQATKYTQFSVVPGKKSTFWTGNFGVLGFVMSILGLVILLLSFIAHPTAAVKRNLIVLSAFNLPLSFVWIIIRLRRRAKC
jgi:cytochrome b subunit of formate dehydrogenase